MYAINPLPGPAAPETPLTAVSPRIGVRFTGAPASSGRMPSEMFPAMKVPFAPPVPPPDLKLRFIDWAKQHGHNPETGAAAFIALQSDRDLQQRQALPGEDRRELRATLQRELEALAQQADVAVQFPPVYPYRTVAGADYRYSLMLVLAEDCVEWTARVWRGLDYQGILVGRGQGPRANYTRLARTAVEQELESAHPHYSPL